MHRAIFLSYAREDTAAAQRLAEALRSFGLEVWFDQSELRGGDAWDQKIRRQIKECALFMPVISERTQARGEGYFRLEWKLAVERTHLMAEGIPFLAPVVVDQTPEGAALVPAEFLRVQWIRLPGSLPTPQFVEQVRRMLEGPRAVSAPPHPGAATATLPTRVPVWAIGALIAVVIAAASAVILTRHAPAAAVTVTAPAEAPAAAVDPKSIAVLPFENMSDDKENAFFSDGVHEDVLTNLSFIHDLHVVSRTSVMQYRGTTKSIRQIGQELGVAYVLEGSVRREGNKVRVTGQLIDARTDEHVWAKAYDRDLTDIFAIQGELAQAIAEALQSVLSPETKVLLARRPTENSEAYDDYVKARQLRNSLGFGAIGPATALLQKAVQLDPNFAQAWAELGSISAFSHFNAVQTDEQLRFANEAIAAAVKIAPDDPAVIEGLGDFYYYAYRDYPRATEQYMRLATIKPNDPVTFFSLGLIQRRQGRMADSVANMRRGLKLDPSNLNYIFTFAQTLQGCRMYAEAEALMREYCDKFPNNLEMAWLRAFNAFEANGSVEGFDAFAKRSVEPSEQSKFTYLQEYNALLGGDWAKVVTIDRLQRHYDGDPDNTFWNQDAGVAEAFAEEGDLPAARMRASEAIAEMKAELVRQPDNSILWAALGLAYSLLGERDETLLCVKKSAELLPESRDAIVGPSNSITCALALAWIGEKDRALSELDRLLHTPYGANIYESRISFGPLHGDPRFRALVADPTNNAPLL